MSRYDVPPSREMADSLKSIRKDIRRTKQSAGCMQWMACCGCSAVLLVGGVILLSAMMGMAHR